MTAPEVLAEVLAAVTLGGEYSRCVCGHSALWHVHVYGVGVGACEYNSAGSLRPGIAQAAAAEGPGAQRCACAGFYPEEGLA